MEEDDQKELQLLPAPQSSVVQSRPLDHAPHSIIRYNRSKGSSNHHHHNHNHRRRPFNGPGLDLQLSISLRPTSSATDHDHDHVDQEDCRTVLAGPVCECVDDQDLTMADDDDIDDHDHDHDDHQRRCVEALKWQAAEQIRLAAMEKAYAERVRELTRREMELAQSEFARARHMWERAREEVEKAERMKEKAITTKMSSQMDNTSSSTCMEITCQSCRQRFRP